jgi:hypothetical protein
MPGKASVSCATPDRLFSLDNRLDRKSRWSVRISHGFDSVAKHSEFSDHSCRVALLRLFRDCRTAFFLGNTVMQNDPDQVAEAIGNYADCLVVPQALERDDGTRSGRCSRIRLLNNVLLFAPGRGR